MNIDPEIDKKIQDLQTLEQNMQGILLEKQSMQIELNEISNALEEIKKSQDEVYRVLGNIMVKSDKEKLSKELLEREKLLELRLTSIEKQEGLIEKRAEDLKLEVSNFIAKKKLSKPQ